MKLDQRTGQSLIKSAIREPRAPGKYDVFAWQSGGELRSVTVAWRSFVKRAVTLENLSLDDGEEVQTNAMPLPNGVGRHAARYVGSFRVDKRSGPNDAAPDDPAQ